MTSDNISSNKNNNNTHAHTISISQTEIEKLFSNIGVNTEKTSAVIDRYGKELINLRDEQGNHVLTKAIQMNDGYVVTALLERGVDIHGLIKENQTGNDSGDDTNTHNRDTFYDYARKYATYGGREPIALNAIESFFQARAQCPVTLMDTATLLNLQKPDYTLDTIKIYHGARSSNSPEDLSFYLEKVVPNGIKEKSPTLAAFPVGQFFKPGSIGFSYEIPRALIIFDGEKNDKAVISMDTTTGIAHILNDEKLLAFKEFKSEVIYRPEIRSKMTYNPYTQSEDEFDVTTSLLDSQQVALLTQMKNRLNEDYEAHLKNTSQSKVMNRMSAMREQFFGNKVDYTNKEKPTI